MKEFNPESIRNISLIGHGGSGKTTIAENILFKAGEITGLVRLKKETQLQILMQTK